MCELLGMDCNVPTDIVFSFAGFAKRGGRTGPHGDGWGLCLYEGRALRDFREPDACATSPLAGFLRANPIKTKLAVAHIRRATRGARGLANTHPFVRELWGRYWAFAHNGTVRGVRDRKLGRYKPVGETDSEHAFCWMLEALRSSFREYPRKPRDLWEALADLGSDVARTGTFNFLLSDARFLYARCHTKLCHIVRKHPFARATLSDEDVTIDFREHTTPRDRVAVVATMPLTRDERWTIAEPGTMLVLSDGALRATLASPSPASKRARR